MKVLLSAYACRPNSGSEPGVGWNWALEIAKRGHHVYVVTRRRNQKAIEEFCTKNKKPENVEFFYYDIPAKLLWLKKLSGTHLYYQLWQYNVSSLVRKLDHEFNFDILHHITFGVYRQNTYLHNLRKPLIIGPLGGGERMPDYLIKSLPLHEQLFEHSRLFMNKVAFWNPSLSRSFTAAKSIYLKTRETRSSLPAKYQHKSIIAKDVGCFPTLESGNQVKSRNGIFRVLFVGRLLLWKGPHLAIEAFRKFHEIYKDSQLEIIGNGRSKDYLLDLIHKARLEHAVKVVEHIPQTDLFKKFESSDVFLFPTLHDSSGWVIYEAISYRLPIVTLNINGPGCILDNAIESSIAIDNMTSSDEIVESLFQQLKRLYEEPEYYQEISAKLRHLAVQNSWERVVGNVYADIEKDVNLVNT